VTKTDSSDSFHIKMSLCAISFNLQIHLSATVHMKVLIEKVACEIASNSCLCAKVCERAQYKT
jgi:hypothetical protein